tara:strand:- start:396 stop:1283 length:888 start_codon:yes stop_codon:yes gene_type:complete
MSKNIKVSVIVNCFNGQKYLHKCIGSILNQEYQNFEIIFWDNNSSDNSIEIAKKFKDDRIKIFKNTITEKLYKARNKAINKSSGELIAFLDCDDWWETDFLSSREKTFNDINYDFFYTNTNLYLEKKKKFIPYRKKKLPSGNISKELYKDYFICISGLVVRKEIFSKIGKFDENFNIIGDFDFVMKMAHKFYGKADNNLLLNYRSHDDNFLKTNREMYYKEFKEWVKKIDPKIIYNNELKLIKEKLSYLEISYLIEELKNFDLFIKILRHSNFNQKIKFLILFFLPLKLIKLFRK